MSKIPLTKPYITNAMKEAVAAVLDTGMLTEGQVAEDFEVALARYVGEKYAVASSNCTTGLEMALRAVGLQAGDEVIIPDFTYPAGADAVVLAGGTAVLADVDPESMLLTPALAEKVRTKKTKVVMPVPAFGNPLEYDLWSAWAADTGILRLEDAAPALGAEYKGARVGAFSDITVFSFHPRKTLTTGEGGMAVTGNLEWRNAMRSHKRFGMTVNADGASSPPFVSIGSNFKMSDLLAALGLEQLKLLDELLGRRRELAATYLAELKDLPGVVLPKATPGGVHAFQTFCLLTPERDRILLELRASDIEAQIGTYVLHQEPAFRSHPRIKIKGSFPGADRAGTEALALPMFHEMTDQMQERVIQQFKKSLRRCSAHRKNNENKRNTHCLEGKNGSA